MSDCFFGGGMKTNVLSESASMQGCLREGEADVILEIEGLEQRLTDRDRPEEFVVYVRHAVSVRQGDFVALLGPSGCGKTTLLTVLGLLRAPSNPKSIGRFVLWDDSSSGRREIDLAEAWHSKRFGLIEGLRRKQIGFALQSGELLPALSVAENIAAPLHLNGIARSVRERRVRELIETFGLCRLANNGLDQDSKDDLGDAQPRNDRDYDLSSARANKLSGGEYQRVSLARAIAHHPSIVFVDEPTSALNRELARGALRQFQQLYATAGSRGAAVMITHDEELASEFANVVIRMQPLKGRPAGEVVEVIRKTPNCISANLGTPIKCND